MKTNKKITLHLILSVLIFLLPGCSAIEEPVEIILQPGTAEQPYNPSARSKFQQPAQKGPTAVEGAIELAKKHARLTEEIAEMRQQNQNLLARNNTLKNRLNESETQLHQTQKELAQANELLREMVVELNNWKVSVLGFQSEMRQADKTQMEALLKILSVLGGEVKIESNRNDNPAKTDESANNPAGSQTRPGLAAKNTGDKNE